MSDTSQDTGEALDFDEWLSEEIATQYEMVKDHPDECDCRECYKLEILVCT